jgi:hypothetical protein
MARVGDDRACNGEDCLKGDPVGDQHGDRELAIEKKRINK